MKKEATPIGITRAKDINIRLKRNTATQKTQIFNFINN